MVKKINIITLFCLLSASNVLSDEESFFSDKLSFADVKSTLEAFGSTCDPKPTEENLREIIFNKENASRETKCFRRCLVEFFDLHVSDSNQMNVAKLMEFASMINPKKIDEIKAMIEFCNEEYSEIEDKCEAAHLIAMCLLKEAKDNDFEIPEWSEEDE